MLRTEQPSSYSRHTNYYQLWLEKKKEIQKLEINLLDSKKVIRTLHQKLTDILKSIKIFEANQDLANSDQGQESRDVNSNLEQAEGSAVSACQSPPGYDQVIILEDNDEGGSSDMPKNSSESLTKNCNETIENETVATSQDIQPLSVLDNTLHSLNSFTPIEIKGNTNRKLRRKQKSSPKENLLISTNVKEKTAVVKIDRTLSSPDEEVKGAPTDLRGKIIELVELVDNNSDEKNLSENMKAPAANLTFPVIVDSSEAVPITQADDRNQAQEQESSDPAFAIVPVEVQIILSDNEGKNETCEASKNESELMELSSQQDFCSESVSTSPKNQPFIALPDFLSSEFTFETEYEKQIKFPVKPKEVPKDDLLASDFQEVAESFSRKKANGHGNLSMNIFECYKTEPMEVLNDNEETTTNNMAAESTEKNTSQDSPEDDQVYLECSLCHEEFKIVGNLNRQLKSDMLAPICGNCQNKPIQASCYLTKGKKYVCEICGKIFSHPHFLASHSFSHKKDDPQVVAVYDQFLSGHNIYDIVSECQVSVEGTALNQQPIEHQNGNSSLKPHKCSICGKCFSRTDHLRRHYHNLHISRTGKQYKCDVCQKTFIESDLLIAHLRSHEDEKPYECKVCGKGFAATAYLKQHQITHSEAKPYKCSICGKCFNRSSVFRRHLLLHTAEKPYECDFCEKKFSLSYNLRSHLRTHTGEKPYPCDMCGRSFASPLYHHRCSYSKTKALQM